LPAIPLRWFALRLELQHCLSFFGDLQPEFFALFRFPVKLLGGESGSAQIAQRQNFHLENPAFIPDPQHVSHTDLACGFGGLTDRLNPAEFAGVRRKRAGLEESRSPQPFVDSHSFRHGLATRTAMLVYLIYS
jgi:hypothetical protein